MDKEHSDNSEVDYTESDLQLGELDLEGIRDNHPELVLKLEEHSKETGYE